MSRKMIIILVVGVLALGVVYSKKLIPVKPTVILKNKVDETSSSTVYAYSVKGMTCGACEKKIRRNLSQLPGIESIQIDRKNDRVRVSCDAEKVSQNKILEAIESLNYKVEALADKIKVIDYNITIE